jgi:hypothetical protein
MRASRLRRDRAPPPRRRRRTGGGDDRRRIVAVEADRDRAGLDGDEQPAAAGLAEARRAAVASPLTPPAQPRPNSGTRRRRAKPSRRDARFEAGRRDAGGGDGDDAVDLGRARAGLAIALRAASSNRRSAATRGRGRCAPPSRAAARTSRRRDEVALAMPALSNTPDKAVEQRRPREGAAADRLRLGLREAERRNRRGNGNEAAGLHE